MPSVTAPDGTTKYIPGVYTDIRVRSSLPGPLPEFHVPVVIGDADWGVPYNANDLKYSDEAEFSPFVALGTASAVADEYGPASDIAIAAKYAKRHGLPFAYYVSCSALVRCSVPAHSTGPVVEMNIYSKKFGAPGGHIKIAVSGSGVVVTPLKHFARLAQDVSVGDTRIYVRDNTWVKDGQAIELGDNNSANVAYLVKATDGKGTEFDANGQEVFWVDITTTASAAVSAAETAASGYGMIVEYDTTRQETSGTLANGQALVDWLNDTSKHIGASKAATFSNAALLTQAEKPMKEVSAWGTVVPGASPAGTLTEHNDFISDLDSKEWDAFLLREQIVPRAFLLVESLTTVHAAWRDWAITKRAAGYPVSITTGCDWGDTNLAGAGSTNPKVRATALDNQDIDLWAGGMDYLDAYKSLAPAVFGMRIAGGIAHNLTNDALSYSTLEIKWDERVSGNLTTLHKAGVGVYRLSGSRPYRFVVSLGLNTLQANTQSWNVDTADTCLIMQRDQADFVDRVLKEDLDGSQLGADKVDPSTISAVIIKRALFLKDKRGLIEDFSISSITLDASGNGYNVVWGVKLPTTTDFITVTTYVNIGE